MERGSIATKLIIAATTDADMLYAAGLSIIDPFILIDTGKKKRLLLSSLEYGWAKRLLGRKKAYEVVLLDPYYQAVKKRMKGKVRKGSVLARIAAMYLKELRIKKVVVSPQMRVGDAEQLRKLGIKITLKPLYDRSVKSKKEIAEITKVRNATVKALRHCVTIIKKSRKNARKELMYKGKKLTSEFLRIEARKILLDHACEAQEMIISHGPQSAFAHDFGSGVIKWGEPILMDFFPRSLESGYWFDMTRTVCHGKPSPELRKLYKTVKKAQDAALKKVKAGVSAGVVHKAAADVFIAAGYETNEQEGYIHSTGHGVGLEIHEAPSLHDGATERLKKGMVLTVEPGLYYKKIGGVRLENTVVVTTTGYNDLTKMGRVL